MNELPQWLHYPLQLGLDFAWCFLIYLSQRTCVNVLWSSENRAANPVRCYMAVYVVALCWSLLTLALAYAGMRWGLIEMYVICPIIMGVPGWIGVLIRSRRGRAWRKRVIARQRGPFQVRLQDLIVGSLALGVGLTIIDLRLPAEFDPARVLTASYCILSMCGTFAALLDVCRYHAVAVTPLQRAMLLGVLPVLSSQMLSFMSVLVTWLAWRRTMALAAMVTPEPAQPGS